MAKSVQAQITEVIKKALPAETAGVMSAYLNEAKVAISENKDLSQKLERARDSLDKSQAAESILKQELEKMTNERDSLQMLAENVEIRDRELRERMLEIRFQAATSNAAFARNVALGLVRNSEYRKTALNTVPHPVEKNDYGQVETHPAAKRDEHGNPIDGVIELSNTSTETTE